MDLLKAFLYDERFPALFELNLYGSIIGMFELNNLSELPAATMTHLMMCLSHTHCMSWVRMMLHVNKQEPSAGQQMPPQVHDDNDRKVLDFELFCVSHLLCATMLLSLLTLKHTCAGLYVASPVEDYAIAATVDTEGGFDPTEQHMAHLIASEDSPHLCEQRDM